MMRKVDHRVKRENRSADVMQAVWELEFFPFLLLAVFLLLPLINALEIENNGRNAVRSGIGGTDRRGRGASGSDNKILIISC